MVTIGIRELRAHLSEYLKRVEEGETFYIAKNGRKIARITPCREEVREPLLELLDEENIRWSGDKPKGSSETVSLEGSPASDAVIDERR